MSHRRQARQRQQQKQQPETRTAAAPHKYDLTKVRMLANREGPVLSKVTDQLSHCLYVHPSLEFTVRQDDYRFVRAKTDIPAGQILLLENCLTASEKLLCAQFDMNKKIFDDSMPRSMNSLWIEDKQAAQPHELDMFNRAVALKRVARIFTMPTDDNKTLSFLRGDRTAWFNSSMNFNAQLNNIVCHTPYEDQDDQQSLPNRTILYVALISCKLIRAGDEVCFYYPYYDPQSGQIIRDEAVEIASTESIFTSGTNEAQYMRGMERLLRAYSRNPMQKQLVLNHCLASSGVIVDGDKIYSLPSSKIKTAEQLTRYVEFLLEEVDSIDRSTVVRKSPCNSSDDEEKSC